MRSGFLTSNTGAESISQANHDTSTTDADELDEVSPPHSPRWSATLSISRRPRDCWAIAPAGLSACGAKISLQGKPVNSPRVQEMRQASSARGNVED